MIINNDDTHGAAEQWSSWLGPLAGLAGLNFLEVGSWVGNSARWLLRNILTGDNSRLTCVDTWMGGGGMPELKETNLGEFLHRVAPWLGRVSIIQARSEDALPTITDRFDMAYIDGSHEPWDVLSDSVLVWRLVKKGGLIIWDDYDYEKNKHSTGDPRLAIDSFLLCNTGRFELVGVDAHVCIRKL